ncbi:MAG: DUF58 domain-containing protein [Roseibium sp.]
MVTAALDHPGLRLSAQDLLALRDTPHPPPGHRPATRRPGVVPARLPGSGMDLREIRAYSDGDDTRRLDPAATARTGTPHVRSFHEDRDDTVLLVADFRPAMLWGTGMSLRSVRAARLLARHGWVAVARGASVAALAITSSGVAALPARTGVRQLGAIAQMLAHEHDKALQLAADGPLPSPSPPSSSATPLPVSLSLALTRAVRLAPSGARVWLATEPEGIAREDEAPLRRLARRRQVGVLCPLDPAEVSPPQRALPLSFGLARRFARLRAFDPAQLTARMRALGVTVELVADDTI